MTLGDIDDMDAAEVMAWRYWLAIEPRGDRRSDYRAAQVSQAVYSVITSFGGKKAPTLKQNLLSFERPKNDTQEQALRNAAVVLAAFGISHGGSLGKLKEDMRLIAQT